MQDADAFCYICVRSSYHFPIQLTIHQNGINTLPSAYSKSKQQDKYWVMIFYPQQYISTVCHS